MEQDHLLEAAVSALDHLERNAAIVPACHAELSTTLVRGMSALKHDVAIAGHHPALPHLLQSSLAFAAYQGQGSQRMLWVKAFVNVLNLGAMEPTSWFFSGPC